ncbi:MAG TPA: hypothetical protein VMJ10_17930 [Kofleriaceae bacterium]|nr:hypothetical protein [Kofleriaceae bacterium]
MRYLQVTLAALLAFATTTARAQPGPSNLNIEDRSTVDLDGNIQDHWIARDASGLALDPEQFYRDVGRPDLVDARARRHDIAIGTLAGGIALAGVSIYFVTQAASSQPSSQYCDPSQLSFSQFGACGQGNLAAAQSAANTGQTNMLYAMGTGIASAAALGVSLYLFTHPEPISELEAEQLAAQANRRHITGVSPYAASNGGGLVVAGRF